MATEAEKVEVLNKTLDRLIALEEERGEVIKRLMAACERYKRKLEPSLQRELKEAMERGDQAVERMSRILMMIRGSKRAHKVPAEQMKKVEDLVLTRHAHQEQLKAVLSQVVSA